MSRCHLPDPIHPLHRQLLLSDGLSILEPVSAAAPSKMDPLGRTPGELELQSDLSLGGGGDDSGVNGKSL